MCDIKFIYICVWYHRNHSRKKSIQEFASPLICLSRGERYLIWTMLVDRLRFDEYLPKKDFPSRFSLCLIVGNQSESFVENFFRWFFLRGEKILAIVNLNCKWAESHRVFCVCFHKAKSLKFFDINYSYDDYIWDHIKVENLLFLYHQRRFSPPLSNRIKSILTNVKRSKISKMHVVEVQMWNVELFHSLTRKG